MAELERGRACGHLLAHISTFRCHAVIVIICLDMY